MASKLLAFEKISDCIDYLRKTGCVFDDNNNPQFIDTKESLPHLKTYSNSSLL